MRVQMFLFSMLSICCTNAGTVIYDPSLGTLPQAQGWTYVDLLGTNPAPFVSGGILHQAGEANYFQRYDADLYTATSFVLEADIRIISSNRKTRSSDGWEIAGFGIDVNGQNFGDFWTYLAGDAYRFNAATPSESSFQLMPLAGDWHRYRIDVAGLAGTLSIDGVVVAQSVPSVPSWFNHWTTIFGSTAYEGVSETELRFLCYTTEADSCAPTPPNVMPEPSTGALFLGAVAGILLLRNRRLISNRLIWK